MLDRNDASFHFGNLPVTGLQEQLHQLAIAIKLRRKTADVFITSARCILVEYAIFQRGQVHRTRGIELRLKRNLLKNSKSTLA